MVPFEDWFPLATVGATFSALGVIKLLGQHRGIVGGGGKPWQQRLAGSCPTWTRPVNLAVPYVFLGLGLLDLGWLAWLFLRQ
jgi:hypothetical protein